MRPFFSLYGGKFKSARRYPPPRYGTIIEPFAGAAGYATRYADRQVFLYDADPIIAGVWDYLIHAKPSEIRRLPADVNSVSTLRVNADAKNLIGFWLAAGRHMPAEKRSPWAYIESRRTKFWCAEVRDMIADQSRMIRHWSIKRGSYESVPNMTATWFIDPPYNGRAGRMYRFSTIDYDYLSDWCRNRRGQTIVCEADGAKWLPFTPLYQQTATTGKGRNRYSAESVWIGDNMPTVGKA